MAQMAKSTFEKETELLLRSLAENRTAIKQMEFIVQDLEAQIVLSVKTLAKVKHVKLRRRRLRNVEHGLNRL